jgi:hypothetical protein
MLVIGEVLCGIPWGVFQTLTTAYASEVCPIQLRGYLTAYVNLCWGAGILLSSGVVKATEPIGSDWSGCFYWNTFCRVLTDPPFSRLASALRPPMGLDPPAPGHRLLLPSLSMVARPQGPTRRRRGLRQAPAKRRLGGRPGRPQHRRPHGAHEPARDRRLRRHDLPRLLQGHGQTPHGDRDDGVCDAAPERAESDRTGRAVFEQCGDQCEDDVELEYGAECAVHHRDDLFVGM